MNLFINYYVDKNEERNQELIKCFLRNLDCDGINRVYVIGDSMYSLSGKIYTLNKDGEVAENPKAFPIPLQTRPTYKDFFNIINRYTQPNEINIIANSDIYFENIDYNHFAGLKHNDCFALSRWDVQPDGSAVHYNNSGSQDTWIFRGAIKMVEGANFTQGIPGCENKLAYLLQQAGYTVTNPSLSIKTYHLHNSGIRYYDKDNKGRQLPNRRIYRLPHPRINVPIT